MIVVFITEIQSEQWTVDRLVDHVEHNVRIELLDDEILLCCDDCHEIILNYFKKGVID